MTDVSTAPDTSVPAWPSDIDSAAPDSDRAAELSALSALTAAEPAADVLARLEASGWHTLHHRLTVAPPQSVVDHISIGPTGVYVVDDHSFVVPTSGPAPDQASVLATAERIAADIRSLLPPLTRQYVVPVLAYADKSAMSITKGAVHICTTSMIPRIVESRGVVLSSGEIEEVVAALDAALVPAGSAPRVAPEPEPVAAVTEPPTHEGRRSRGSETRPRRRLLGRRSPAPEPAAEPPTPAARSTVAPPPPFEEAAAFVVAEVVVAEVVVAEAVVAEAVVAEAVVAEAVVAEAVVAEVIVAEVIVDGRRLAHDVSAPPPVEPLSAEDAELAAPEAAEEFHDNLGDVFATARDEFVADPESELLEAPEPVVADDSILTDYVDSMRASDRDRADADPTPDLIVDAEEITGPEPAAEPQPVEEPEAVVEPEPEDEAEAPESETVEEPEPVDEPDATFDEPEPVDEPDATFDEPEPVDEPDATFDEPEPVDEPEAAVEPEPAEEPEAAIEPEPNEEPHVIVETTAKPVEEPAWEELALDALALNVIDAYVVPVLPEPAADEATLPGSLPAIDAAEVIEASAPTVSTAPRHPGGRRKAAPAKPWHGLLGARKPASRRAKTISGDGDQNAPAPHPVDEPTPTAAAGAALLAGATTFDAAGEQSGDEPIGASPAFDIDSIVNEPPMRVDLSRLYDPATTYDEPLSVRLAMDADEGEGAERVSALGVVAARWKSSRIAPRPAVARPRPEHAPAATRSEEPADAATPKPSKKAKQSVAAPATAAPAGLSSRGRQMYAAMNNGVDPALIKEDEAPAGRSRAGKVRRLIALVLVAGLIALAALNYSTISTWVSDHVDLPFIAQDDETPQKGGKNGQSDGQDKETGKSGKADTAKDNGTN